MPVINHESLAQNNFTEQNHQYVAAREGISFYNE